MEPSLSPRLARRRPGAVSSNGAIRMKIAISQQTLKINGKAHGRVASGS